MSYISARRANDEETNTTKKNSSKDSSHVDKNPELNKESEVDTNIKDTIEHGNLKRSFHTEKVDDANNNIQHENPEMKKDGRRRTRFSSEIIMQPKINQPHSVDMIIMMVCALITRANWLIALKLRTFFNELVVGRPAFGVFYSHLLFFIGI